MTVPLAIIKVFYLLKSVKHDSVEYTNNKVF
ncbi:hypothetical protein F945_03552 [Acinetobacter rudis CIP 110305]|uniref:Uncharacterized protein n=1 Tax=Acinetobacter rudis CIP 110305 TaxID=421052 RepID=S3MTT3_9GAMM|nr:hypothetical protein F945_03552 [Acinetobacter rudis CIP 110305]